MSKHTKGPWRLGGYIFFPGGGHIAYEAVHAPKRGRIAMAERYKDAQLIAAAPELLEACQLLVADYEAPNSAIGDDWYRKAKAAIAKATGAAT